MRLLPALFLASALPAVYVGQWPIRGCTTEPKLSDWEIEPVEQGPPRRVPEANIELAVSVPLTLREIETILAWERVAEVHAENEPPSLPAYLRQAATYLRRHSGIDLTPEEYVQSEDVI